MLITYLIVSGIALLLAGSCGSAVFLYATDKFVFKSENSFACTYGGMMFGLLMSVIFIGQTCAYIANMS